MDNRISWPWCIELALRLRLGSEQEAQISVLSAVVLSHSDYTLIAHASSLTISNLFPTQNSCLFAVDERPSVCATPGATERS